MPHECITKSGISTSQTPTLNRIAAEEIEEEDECPPPPRRKVEEERYNCDSSEDSENENKEGEWIRVAGDGACPGGGSRDYRMPKSGSGLYYGKNNRHNSSWRNKGTAQSAQRAEVEAAWRWTAWAWAKQIYLTDSAQVHYKLERIIKGESRNKKKKKKKSAREKHADLWEKIERAIEAKGRENFRVEKIKAHQTKKSKEKNTDEENKKRKENEQADLLAVKGAQKHVVDKEYLKERRDFIGHCKAVQIYLIEVMKMRGNKIEEICGNTRGQTRKIGYQKRRIVLQELAIQHQKEEEEEEKEEVTQGIKRKRDGEREETEKDKKRKKKII